MSNGKYEFVAGDVKVVGLGLTVKRIRALVAISLFGVSPGDLGGYIESEHNLQVYGDAWVSGNAKVYGNAKVSGNAQVYGDAWVSGNAKVSGNAQVYGAAWVSGNAKVSGNAQVYGDAQVTPVCISGLAWHVTVCDTTMTIGCQSHTLIKWAKFSDGEIAAMDGKNALRFWRQHKGYLLTLR